MRRWASLLLALALLEGAARAAEPPSSTRGHDLATIGDCAGCHTAPDGRTFAGGRTVPSPFGAQLSANLTPDPATGLGAWTEADFIRALQDGIGREGEHLHPGMPYPYFTEVRQADLRDIFAYLRTLEPVVNHVARDRLAFPFDTLPAIVVWNAVDFRPGEYRPDRARSAEWNRGGYLVEGLGHCGACHTPKNWIGGDRRDRMYRGATVDGSFAPDITGDRPTGLGAWSVDEIAEYLRTGTAHAAVAAGPMAGVVERSTSHMDPADLRAIAVYLKAPPGSARPP